MRNEATSADGTTVGYFVEGHGPPLVVVHGGSQHADDWTRVASHLVDRFTVVRIDRPLYSRGRPVARHALRHEVEDVHAVIVRVDAPVVLLGHSSGGVVALEFALHHPEALAGLILYEPPVGVDALPLEDTLVRAEAAIARGDGSEAMAIFLKELVQFPAIMVWLMRCFPPAWREMCAFAPEQIADARAVTSVRPDRYRGMNVPTLLIGGSRSPAHLLRRLESLASVLARSRTVVVRKWGHLANLRTPKSLAKLVGEFTADCAGQRKTCGPIQ